MSWGSRAGDAQRRTTPSLHTQSTTAARPTVYTHKPAVENLPRVRLADVDQHDFDGDDDIHLSFTADQAMALSQRAQDHIAQWERDNGRKWSESSHIQDDLLIEALAKADDPTGVARALIGAYGGPGWMGQAFVNMAIAGDELVPLPGTIEARNRND